MYRAYARLKLLNYYAYPILPLTYEPKENYVDMIVASMVERGNCVCEIDFVGSLTARANVLNFLSKKYFKKSTGVKQLFTKGSSKDASVLVFTPLERTLHDAMKEKAVQEVYVCRVMVRGMDADDVRAVVSSFPRGGMNDFRAAYVRVKANSLDDVVKPKLSYMKKYAVLHCRIRFRGSIMSSTASSDSSLPSFSSHSRLRGCSISSAEHRLRFSQKAYWTRHLPQR